MGKVKTSKDALGEFAKVTEKARADKEENAETMLNTRVSKKTLKALKVWVAQNETTIQAFVTEVLERELKTRGGL